MNSETTTKMLFSVLIFVAISSILIVNIPQTISGDIYSYDPYLFVKLLGVLAIAIVVIGLIMYSMPKEKSEVSQNGRTP